MSQEEKKATFELRSNQDEAELINMLKKLKFELVLDDTVKDILPISKLVCQTKAEYIAIRDIRLRKENDELKYVNASAK
jgi:hypothetical protein